MLNGKELGAAIKTAFDLKVATGVITSKADLARHFNIKTPSVYDWFKKGSISKDKLPELWRYFSDVVGPEHWGMTEWPYPESPTPDLVLSSPPIVVELKAPAIDAPALAAHEAALDRLGATIGALSPLLQDAGRAALLKWVKGEASAHEAAVTLNALLQASSSIEDGTASMPSATADKGTGT